MSDTSALFIELQRIGNRIPQMDLGCSDALTKLEVVRVMPGKRVVCQCFWQQKPVFAKVFFGDQFARYAERDKRGVELLIASDIITPPLLAVYRLVSDHAIVLIYQAVEGSLNAEQAYSNFSVSERKCLVKQLVKTVAQHHQANLIQTDCHLKNFLVTGDITHTLDGDSVRRYAKLSDNQILRNLSVLLSTIDVLDLESWYSTLLDSYQSVNDLPQIDARKIKCLVNRYRINRVSNYADKKVFRQCTDINIIKAEKGLVAMSRVYSNLQLPRITAEIDTYFTLENLIKNGNTCTVALANIDKQKIVIKRYNIKGFWHRVSYLLRQTRAASSWSNAHRLQLLRLGTARPIALIEKHTLGLKGKTYFLAEYIDAPEMADFFNQSLDKTFRADVVKQTVDLFYRLYLLNISHGDMKATNIKVLPSGKPLLIDLDSMRQHRFAYFAQKAHVRDIKRFMRNWIDHPSLYNAFVKAFKVIYADHVLLQKAQILE